MTVVVFKLFKFRVLAAMAALAVTLSFGFTASANYLSGKYLYERFKDNPKVQAENGRFLQVPVHYERPGFGRTPIYYWFEQPFDPRWPTVVVFDGGPGQSSHHVEVSRTFAGYNFLRFDARGIAFSRPPQERNHTHPDFYSSRNTARDASAIVTHLNLSNVTALGTSAGTHPAMEFARLRPEITKSVVLSSPAFPNSWPDLATQLIFDLVSNHVTAEPDVKPFLTEVAGLAGPGWLGSRVFRILDDHGREGLNRFFRRVKSASDQWKAGRMSLKSFLADQDVLTQESRGHLLDLFNDLLAFDMTVLEVLGTKELGMSYMSTRLEWRDGGPEIVVTEAARHAERFSFQFSDAFVRQEPVTPPVFIVAGTHDPRTPYDGALEIFRTIPSARKTLVTIEGASHCDFGFEKCTVPAAHERKTEATRRLWHRMLDGQPLTKETIDRYNLQGIKRISVSDKPSDLLDCGEVLGGR